MKIKSAQFIKSAPDLASCPESPMGEVAFIGRSNVGKSSLLNALAAREVAIVTDVAGTTRDALSVPIELDGFLVNVAFCR